MHDEIYPVSPENAARAWADRETYSQMYRQSIDDPDGFWAEHGKRVDWIKPFTKVKNTKEQGRVSRSLAQEYGRFLLRNFTSFRIREITQYPSRARDLRRRTQDG